MKSNKHGLNMNTVMGWALAFIGIVVLFSIVADLIPQALTAGDSINSSGLPLGTLFASSGALWYIVAAGLLVAVISYFNLKKR